MNQWDCQFEWPCFVIIAVIFFTGITMAEAFAVELQFQNAKVIFDHGDQTLDTKFNDARRIKSNFGLIDKDDQIQTIKKTQKGDRSFLEVFYWTECSGTKERITEAKWAVLEFMNNQFVRRSIKTIKTDDQVCKENEVLETPFAENYPLPRTEIVLLGNGSLLFTVGSEMGP